MLICNDCKELFDEDEIHTYTEYHGDYSRPGEVFGVCPYCGSSDFGEAELCEECGEYFPLAELNLCYSGERSHYVYICDNCCIDHDDDAAEDEDCEDEDCIE